MAELGDGMVLARVPLGLLREQDVNARTMDDGKFGQLVANIKRRGTLEQLPYCALTDRGVEIVSGHHRVRAAKVAGLEKADVLLDTSGLSRSAIAAKQLAHNAIEGEDDPSVVRQIASLITDVDDMLESALGPEFFDGSDSLRMEEIFRPPAFDWKTVQFTFLPEQMGNLETLCEQVEGADFEGVAQLGQFEDYVRALEGTRKFADTRNVSSTVNAMVKAALEKYGIAQETDSLASIFGHGAIPHELAESVRGTLRALQERGAIENPWDVFGLLEEEYGAQDDL